MSPRRLLVRLPQCAGLLLRTQVAVALSHCWRVRCRGTWTDSIGARDRGSLKGGGERALRDCIHPSRLACWSTLSISEMAMLGRHAGYPLENCFPSRQLWRAGRCVAAFVVGVTAWAIRSPCVVRCRGAVVAGVSAAL